MRNADLQRYAELHWKIKEKEGEVEDLKKKLDKLGLALLENMTKDGVQRVNIDGSTLYVLRTVRASAGGNMPALIEALKEAAAETWIDEEGREALRYPMLAAMITETVNANTLSAWVREYDDPDDPKGPEEIVASLPSTVQPAIKVTEKFELRCVKG